MSAAIQKLEFEEIFSKRPNLQKLKQTQRSPIYTLVENIRSMHNVGSIFRTSDGVLLNKLFLSGYTAVPPRKEIDKTALGATESVPWEYTDQPEEALLKLKSCGTKIIAVEHTNASVEYTKYNYEFPLCVVMGNEVEGVSQKVLDVCDAAVELPMLGLKQSLNVSVAYGVIIYHIFAKLQANSPNFTSVD
jgi:tRNA G18 (ribose-2'-O)-methylase SpoU